MIDRSSRPRASVAPSALVAAEQADRAGAGGGRLRAGRGRRDAAAQHPVVVDRRSRRHADPGDQLPAQHLDQYDLQQVISSNSANLLHGSIGYSYVPEGDGTIVSSPPDPKVDDSPNLSRNPPTTAPETVSDAPGNERYLVLAVPASSNTGVDGYLVAWTPLDDITATMHRLVLLELLITFGLLVLFGVIAGLIIRRELKPLETMATAADEIAGGDLERPGGRRGPEHRDRPARPRPSTACWTGSAACWTSGSRARSGCGSSSPTPPTSCARRSRRCAATRSSTRRGAAGGLGRGPGDGPDGLRGPADGRPGRGPAHPDRGGAPEQPRDWSRSS